MSSLAGSASQQSARSEKVPQSFDKRLIGIHDKVIDGSAFQFVVDELLIEPRRAAVGAEFFSTFGLAGTQESGASKRNLGRVAKLQHDTVVPLADLLQ